MNRQNSIQFTAFDQSRSRLYISHHGVKGMKWGVRRYQNIDGSLTPKGERSRIKLEKKSNKILRKLDRKRKGKRQLELEEEYRELGFSKNEAAIQAYKRRRTENVIKTVIAASATVAAIYAGKKVYNDRVDKIIKPGTVLQNISNDNNKGIADAFYFSWKLVDKQKYRGWYGAQVYDRMITGKNLGSKLRKHGISTNNDVSNMIKRMVGSGKVINTSVSSTDSIKVASPKTSRDTLKKLMETDAQFRKDATQTISNLVSEDGITPARTRMYKKASSSLKKGRIDRAVYDAFNTALVDHNPHNDNVHKKFYKALADKGYNALIDVHDQKYSGYNSSSPAIMFNPSVSTKVKSRSSMSVKEIEESQAVVAGFKLISNFSKVGVTAIASGTMMTNGLKSRRARNLELAYSNYKDEHPNSKLGYNEFLVKRKNC